jgi:hypothetical protein
MMRTELSTLTDVERIRVLLEEYRALNALLMVRLQVTDQRLPWIGGLLAAIVGSLAQLPGDLRLMVLLAAPALSASFFQTVAAHARSKEDVLRRLDEIERQVNRLAREELLVFQSQHPNRKRAVGGRSGQSTLLAILVLCLVSLTACGFLFVREVGAATVWLAPYVAYLLGAAAGLASNLRRLARYRYEKAPPGTASALDRR